MSATRQRSLDDRLFCTALLGSGFALLGSGFALLGSGRLGAAMLGAALLSSCDSEPPSKAAADADSGSAVDAAAGSSLDAAPSENSAPDANMASQQPTALIHNARWRISDASGDPFSDRPSDFTCSSDSFGEEIFGGRLVYFVRTDACEYLTVAQASRVDLWSGDTVVISAWLFPLDGPEGASAHIAIRIGDLTIAERRVTIPAPETRIVEEWLVPRDIPSGTPVYLHVHNHGSNEYALISLERWPAAH